MISTKIINAVACALLTITLINWKGAPAVTPAAASTTQMSSENTAFDDLIRLSETYLKEKYSQNPKDFSLPTRVTRYPDRYEVTWVLPPNVKGGTPTVFVNRKTLEVLKASFSQ